MIQIREYLSSDLESLTELMTDLGSPSTIEDMKNRMELIGLNPYYFTFVATINEKVVGMIGVRLNSTYTSNKFKTQISSFVTKKEYQGQGVGKALINYIEEWTRNKGSDFLYLTSGIKEERISAHEFYKNRGFNVTGYRFVKRLN
ncbi:GNAT family N-acetyltransferase [Paenibacillus sp. KN14-4R]|uniref:GNAT family N-acetyltransferase n=1 Tax=Paenibacillus sp. KN14-4R TaxID=3445773 RepID=UPI003F9F4918